MNSLAHTKWNCKYHVVFAPVNDTIRMYKKGKTYDEEFKKTIVELYNNKKPASEIKDYYDNKDFDSNDVYDISKGTAKEDELFDYAEIPSYLKSNNESYEEKDDFEISL